MTKTGPTKAQSKRAVKTAILLLILLFLWLGLNYRQLYAAWAVRSETQLLENLARNAPDEFQNPASAEDDLNGKLSSDFWEFTTMNGGGESSNKMAWHSTVIAFNQSLSLQHFSDPVFEAEESDWHAPAADQYNNVTLIGASGFRPSRSRDVVLKFSAWVDREFYGTAGVIFQPVGTVREDGLIVKPLDMLGFSIAGRESSIAGINGPFCYLALNSIPVTVQPLPLDARRLHTYEIRLRWMSRTEWLGSLAVDGLEQCQIAMPPFGPVEVHVWSDNSLVLTRPRRWWEIGPAMDLKYQNGGDKQFNLGMIQIFEAER